MKVKLSYPTADGGKTGDVRDVAPEHGRQLIAMGAAVEAAPVVEPDPEPKPDPKPNKEK